MVKLKSSDAPAMTACPWRSSARLGVAAVRGSHRLWLAWALCGVLAGLAGCGSAPRQPSLGAGSVVTVPPEFMEPVTTPVSGSLSPEQANDVTLSAIGLVGTPYRYGGNTPESGFDCSGLIGYVYQTRAAIKPPRTTAELTFWGQSVPRDQLQTGDLVLFGKSTVANHAGIYVGGGRFVHAPSSGGTVRLERLDARHWAAQNPRFKRP
ncbi:C40 family peptidase [Rhodoferax sp.]|uniref:C40 family peptidase n=1 Tax=Rhodoferax sp. TaxID=50421 RepID=UPI00261C1210|nr:C40 family peptidase [Rhodoferax sp.]MDD2810075.1 C40 family peptidase [Rhodoferax sp.]MDD4943757.1 C40 family peptidase [Rhodoferax sp.]